MLEYSMHATRVAGANKKATNKGGFSLSEQKSELKSHHLLVLLTQTFNA